MISPNTPYDTPNTLDGTLEDTSHDALEITHLTNETPNETHNI